MPVKSRREFLQTGLVSGAGLAVSAWAGPAFGQDGTLYQDEKDHWGRGSPPGQALPEAATNGPWRSLRAVQQKKVFDMHAHAFQTAKQGSNYREDGQMHVHGFVNYVDALIESMDRHGIERAMFHPNFDTYEKVRDAAFEPHKDRLLLAVGWPPESLVKKQKGFVQLGEEAGLSAQLVADEFERQLTVDGARMIGENAGSAVRGLLGRVSAKELGPVVDVLLKHDVPIAFHTGWTPTGSARSTATARPYETASHWAEAIGSFLTNFPDVKTILTHTGGQFGDLDGSEALRLLYSFDNVYCDTSKAPPRIVQAAVAGIGAERVMFGSDWNRPDLKTYGPYFMRASYQHWYNLNTIAIADITEDQRDWVLYRSAHKLLKLDA